MGTARFVLPILLIGVAGLAAPIGAQGGADEPSPIALEAAAAQLEQSVQQTGALGQFRDKRTNQLVVAVPASGTSTFSASMANPLLNVRIESRAIDVATISAIYRRIDDIAAGGGFDGYGYMAWFSPDKGRVILGTNAPAATQVVHDYPNTVEVTPGTPRLLSRAYDVSPHYGGAIMLPEGMTHCTSGFSVTNSNGYDRMVTAAHCSAALEDTVDPNQGDTFGTVKKRSGYPDNDFELVGENTISQAPRIYVSNGLSGEAHARVYDAHNPSTGITGYCWSGGVTYNSCSQQSEFETLSAPKFCPVNLDGSFAYPPGPQGDHCNHSVAQMCPTESDWVPQFGDSGAPVYISAGTGWIGIRGIVIGVDNTGVCAVVELYNEIASQYDVTAKIAP